MSVRVGLVGAGPWAGIFHAPMLSAHAGTTLAAVWSRRPEAARGLAAAHGATAAASFEDLLDRCEAVAFAVPPDIQAELAAAGGAGRQAPDPREAARLHPRGRRADRGRGRRGRRADAC